jgi:hypothetical protein
MYVCVRGINFTSVSTIFLLEPGIVQKSVVLKIKKKKIPHFSEQFQILIEKQKIPHFSEQFQILIEKQKIPHFSEQFHIFKS